MLNRIQAMIIISLFLFSSILFTSVAQTAVSAQDESVDGSAVNQFYIEYRTNRTGILVPYEPDDGDEKLIMVGYGDYFNVSHGLVDRKYNPDIKPEVELYIDSHGAEGLLITVRVEFRYFVDNMLPQKANVIAYFDQYETDGDDEPELVSIRSSLYSDTPVDITDPEFGALMRLSVSFEGGDVNDTVDILCGDGGYHSYVITPYDRSYSSTLADDDGDDDTEPVNTALCYIVGILFIVIIVIMIIYSHFKEKN